MSESIKKKDPFWQFVRGLCIISVILIHCKNGMGYSDLADGYGNYEYWVILRQVIDFPVAIFIFLAGYFVKIDLIQENKYGYIMKRIGRLVCPYLIWSFGYTTIVLFSNLGKMNLMGFLSKFFLGLSAPQLYFILVLIQLTILTPLLEKIIRTKKWFVALFLITPIYLVILYSYAIVKGNFFSFFQAFFPAWFGFYYLALCIRIKGWHFVFQSYSFLKAGLIFFSGLLLSVGESLLLQSAGVSDQVVVSQVKVSSFLYVIAIITLLFSIKDKVQITESNWLVKIGNISFGIYFVHYIWILISAKVLNNFAVLQKMLPVYQLLQVVLVMGLSIVSLWIINKILGKSFTRKYLGL